jgi:hypothetical protein
MFLSRKMESSTRIQISAIALYLILSKAIQLMQAKASNSGLLENMMLLTFRYMDYWIPVCVFLSFPIWILPGVFYYLAWKVVQSWKSMVTLGRTLLFNTASSALSYAILRGNGRYLRVESEDVHKKQFYDYTSRSIWIAI